MLFFAVANIGEGWGLTSAAIVFLVFGREVEYVWDLLVWGTLLIETRGTPISKTLISTVLMAY